MNYDALELIKIAMLHEDEGAEYYESQAKQWHVQEVCDNFKALADEERLHSKWLQELFEAKKEHGDFKLFSFLGDSVQAPQLFNWADIKKISDMTLKDVLLKAIKMERSSYEFYESLQSKSEDKDFTDLLVLLIDWEKNHYTTLKEAYDKL